MAGDLELECGEPQEGVALCVVCLRKNGCICRRVLAEHGREPVVLEARIAALEGSLRRVRKLRDVALHISGATSCPDPAEGGCVGGPIPGLGCVNEAARYLRKELDEACAVLEAVDRAKGGG